MSDKNTIELLENDIDLAPYREYLLNTITDLNNTVQSLEDNNKSLEDNNKSLEDNNKSLEDQKADLELKIEALQEALNNKNKMVFGKKSEKNHPGQLNLFNEVEEVQVQLKKIDNIKKEKKQVKKLNEQLNENITKEIEYKLDDISCPNCDGTLHEMKTSITNELVYIPSKYEVVSHKLYHYSCRSCEKNSDQATIVSAKAFDMTLPKSCASSSTIASIIYNKFVLHLPLYRQVNDIKASTNFDISIQTLSNWVTKANELYYLDIYKAMKADISSLKVVHADETPLRVLNDTKMTNNSGKGYMWVYTSGQDEVPFTLYEYQPSRTGIHATNFLSDFSGYLHCDGYSGYNGVSNVQRIGCFAHARRNFVSALDQVPKDLQSDNIAKIGVDFCSAVFHINQSSETNENKHKQMSKLMDNFKKWLDEVSLKSRPKLQFGKAVTYCLNQWEYLSNVLLDITLEVSNNRAERAVKPFVIGRKNWLFSNTAKGANTSACLYSIVESAKQNKLDVQSYLEHVIFTMSRSDYNKEDINKLLPYSKELPDYCYVM